MVVRWGNFYNLLCFCFFFQAEDGIRDAQESRGLGDVYKRQKYTSRLRKIVIKKDGELTTLIGEKMGRQIFLVGNLSHEILSEIFESIADEGG